MSRAFIENTSALLQGSTSILHLNFSGMSLDRQSLEELAQTVVGSSMMMALHLNDNGIR